MNSRKSAQIICLFVIAVSLIAVSLSVMLMSGRYGRLQYDLINDICGEILEREPEAGEEISAALKEVAERKKQNRGNEGVARRQDVLASLGYRVSDFSGNAFWWELFSGGAGFLAGNFIFLAAFLYRNRREAGRIQALADYLEQVNTGNAPVLSARREDEFSKLEDEIYKTVTFLYQTRDGAVQAKNKFADQLSNIAHQIKTPITAISLNLQRMEGEGVRPYPAQIQKQLMRLIHLEEALLGLARLDSGALVFDRKKIDVYTLLVLAAENLQELLLQSGSSVEIPEQGDIAVTADLDWTMEAIMNLMKNCVEHHAGGTVHCFYDQNPLYTEILIWDEGEGFIREEIPHLFERFYRGQMAVEGGIGIGLALARELIERQNGTIRAKNMPEGGACFEIHFYCRKED